MLYTLNLHSAVRQLYLNKNGRKRKNEIQKKRERERRLDMSQLNWGTKEGGVCGKGDICRSSVVKG